MNSAKTGVVGINLLPVIITAAVSLAIIGIVVAIITVKRRREES